MKIIDQKDFVVIRQLAMKYNMSVADFGRTITRQSERAVGRAIRLSEKEYEYIKSMAAKNNMPVTRFLGLACHAYLAQPQRSIPIEPKTDDENRNKRVEARLYNASDEKQLLEICNEYSMGISTLIRYCGMNFDGRNFVMKGE